MKRTVIGLVALLVALLVATSLSACGSGGDSSGSGKGDATSGGAGETASDAPADVDALKAALEADHSSADWYADLRDLTLETRLGTSVLVLHVSWAMQDADWETTNVKLRSMRTAIDSYRSPVAINLTTQGTDGQRNPLGSTGVAGAVPMGEAFDLPAAPATDTEVAAWLEAVFGPGGIVELGAEETWYDSITSIEYTDPGYGMQLVVSTTLGADDVAELGSLYTALATTASPLLEQLTIQGADGYVSVGGSVVANPGDGGYYYIPR